MREKPKADKPVFDIEDADDLLRYLRDTGRIDQDETPVVRILHGGVSNKTILLQRPDGSRWVLKQALPKLRVQADWFSDPARIHVEANGLRYLPCVTPPNSTHSCSKNENSISNAVKISSVENSTSRLT